VSITTGTELCRMSATEAAEAIRSGQVSSQEVIGAHLRRIEEVNSAVNAVPVVLGEQALEAARAADRAAARDGELPPSLHIEGRSRRCSSGLSPTLPLPTWTAWCSASSSAS